MLKDEGIATKEQLQNSGFDDFSASDGWLDCWKTTYSVKELGVVGEAGNMSLETVTSWMERKKNWNIDESGRSFKALLDKGLVEKGKQAKGAKN